MVIVNGCLNVDEVTKSNILILKMMIGFLELHSGITL
jgi:hypothetical protein